MTRNMITIAALAFISLFAGAQAQADLIITIGRSDFQPDENLLFNGDDLAEQGTTVQGWTNNTHEVFNITGHEELVTPSNGQARVDATADSELDFVLIDALRSVVYYTEFEANLHVGGKTSGTFTVTACDQAGVCESATFTLDSGENAFSVASTDGQLIDTVRFQSTVEVDDVRQIRLGGVQELGGPAPPPQAVSEPGVIALMGLGLAGLAAYRRKRA
jgi:hypothetical protein